MKIMLLTDIPPCMNFTAGIVLNKMCDFLLEAGFEVCCFAVKDINVDALIPPDKAEKMKFQIVKKPVEGWGHLKFGPIASYIGNHYTALFLLPKIACQASAFAKENQVDLIWCVVQGQTMIKLAEPIAHQAGLPYVIQVWDPPEWWLMENRFDRYTTRSVMKSFQKALHHSRCCIAASWAMADYYSQQYNCKSIPVILGFEPERIQEKKKNEDNSLIIDRDRICHLKGVVGFNYCYEWSVICVTRNSSVNSGLGFNGMAAQWAKNYSEILRKINPVFSFKTIKYSSYGMAPSG